MRTILFCAMSVVTAATWAQAKMPVSGPDQPEPSKARQAVVSAKSARQLIQESMRREPIVNIRLIVSQRLYDNSSVFQQVKVEMSRDGKVHQIVLSPLSLQGTELVDDGRTLRTFTSDDRCLIEQPSANHEKGETAFRMNLVDRNYGLRIDRKEVIAGRTAYVVEAVPRDSTLETRCLSIDAKTGFLLRLETCRPGQASTLHLDTKMVEFPSEFSENTFKLDPPSSRTVTFKNKCVSPKSAGDLAEELGFEPVVPTSLPHGFATEELQASLDARAHALIVRITDGLSKATVLEWRKVGNSNATPPAGTLVQSSGRLTLLVSGDIPEEVKSHILRAFVTAARVERAFSIPTLLLSWDPELVHGLDVFPVDGDSEEMAPIILAIPFMIRK